MYSELDKSCYMEQQNKSLLENPVPEASFPNNSVVEENNYKKG